MTTVDATPGENKAASAAGDRRGVLVIYTGGTIGSKPSQQGDPDSPQVVVPWTELLAETPELAKVQQQFPVDAYEGIPPLDSCNVGPDEWRLMARAIQEHYEQYNGFVILHGTDTMVYTATALSYMLRGLAKPVILTGAQRSAMVSYRNDATQNFLTALLFANPQAAGLPLIPEVCVYFGGKLLRGNRTVKRDTNGYDAYESPNLTELGIAGDSITVDERLILKPEPTARFTVRDKLNTNVLPIFISPGIQNTEMVKRQLETPGLRAVVVQAFGSGNIPTSPEFVGLFKEAHKKGIVLATVSQCRRGPVELGIYETSAALLEAGFVAANDLTLEAAQVKLMYLLGNAEARQDEVELAYQQALSGDQSESLFLSRLTGSAGNAVVDDNDPGYFRIRGDHLDMPDAAQLHEVGKSFLRLRGASLVGPPTETDEPTPVELRLYIDVDEDEIHDVLTFEREKNTPHPAFLGSYTRYPRSEAEKAISGNKGVLMFDITEAVVGGRLNSVQRVSFTVVVPTTRASLTWDSVEVAVFLQH